MKKLSFLFSFVFAMMLMVNNKAAAQAITPEVNALLTKYTCWSCHQVDKKLVGPSYKEVMQKKKYKPEQIVKLIAKPNPKNWPDYPPMAALTNVPKADALKIATWISSLK